jgi:hypothetical protein
MARNAHRRGDRACPGGFLSIESQALLSLRRVEIRSSNGTLTRKSYVDSSEQPWTDEARRWLADNLPFFVRRSGVAAQERVRQLVVTQGVDGALGEIRLLQTGLGRPGTPPSGSRG